MQLGLALASDAQVRVVARGAIPQFGLINQLHPFLEKRYCPATIIHALATSRLNYCSVLNGTDFDDDIMETCLLKTL